MPRTGLSNQTARRPEPRVTLRCELGYRVFFRGHNFAHVGKSGGRTPAMRLGFAKEPLDFEDILWPGQRVPRPKRARRRGKKAIAA